MNAQFDAFRDELRGAWRFRWAALGAAFVLATIGWVAVFALPDQFAAEARIFVDTGTALKPALQGLTLGQDVNAQLNFVRQSLLAGEQLEKIAADAGVLKPSVTNPRNKARILTDLSERIEITVHSAGDRGPNDREFDKDTAGSIYAIYYKDSQRPRALLLVRTLLNALVEQTLGGKREGSQGAQKFLEGQIAEYEKRLRDAEDRLADFKKRNIGLMPTEQGGYFAQLQAELDAGRKAEGAISVAVSRRNELDKQLHGETAVAAIASGPAITVNGMPAAGDTLTRIRMTQARLDDLLLKYTPRHPDVIAANEELEELRARRAAELESIRRGDAGAVAASGAGSNPVYQSIQLALNQADVEIAALRGELAQHQSKAADLRRRLDTAPQVEAEYAQLNRDYDVNKTEYTALMANYAKARLGEQADDAGSVRFDIVQPPTVTFRPVAPNRPLLLIAVLIGAILAGAILAHVLHFLRPVVYSVQGLAELTGLTVIGAVSSAFAARNRQLARRSLIGYCAAAGCLLAACSVALILDYLGVRVSLPDIGFG
jgi:polysaccharide chain length determinant protein (PEP-CTERM system associated)